MIDHKMRAELAIDHLTAARHLAQDAGDRAAAEAYTKAIQRITRVTDCISAPEHVAEAYRYRDDVTIETNRGVTTIDLDDGTHIAAWETDGHGYQYTLDGRRHEWSITGPAAARYGVMQHHDTSHRDQDLDDAIRYAIEDAARTETR